MQLLHEQENSVFFGQAWLDLRPAKLKAPLEAYSSGSSCSTGVLGVHGWSGGFDVEILSCNDFVYLLKVFLEPSCFSSFLVSTQEATTARQPGMPA